ncbi:PREDICTED: MFS-type transporter SLC18B1-like isoform X2 [Priapulus caudatus]|uniref:MFS-type transporter SLC18B1-like isoform X2 n=1 Tax=Priapulus caudatus TaxID=37621 RepID=A0ABM1DPN0_PRICU|nr:PREDICTED: MFS-type transporter SLC18B1-like isoform X2 [Priapulus caudatus]
MGTSVNVICFLFIGPAPFFHSETYLSVVIFCLALQGAGLGGQLVPSLLDMLKTAKQHGFPDDYTTYALVSGIFNAFFALGAFLGPTIGGIMDDYMD